MLGMTSGIMTRKLIGAPGYFLMITEDTETGVCKLWGSGSNEFGELGLPSTTTGLDALTELGIPAGQPKYIVSQAHSTFVINNNGWMYATGRNDKGQLGLGDTTDRYGFARVGTFLVKEARTQAFYDPENRDPDTNMQTYENGYSFLITKAGLLYSCGCNDHGQLGHGDKTDRHTFTICQLSGILGKVVHIFPAGTATWITTVEGDHAAQQHRITRIYAVGSNKYGLLEQPPEDVDYLPWTLFKTFVDPYYPPAIVVGGDSWLIAFPPTPPSVPSHLGGGGRGNNGDSGDIGVEYPGGADPNGIAWPPEGDPGGRPQIPFPGNGLIMIGL
jgi:hypothetical protein